MTDSEKTQIVNQVLAAIQTNSRSVMQLTPVNSLGADDWFEISGGKRISYNVLATLIASLSSDGRDDLLTAISQKTLQSATITCTATSATLSIATPETTITCTIPIATDDASGIITAEMKRHLEIAYDKSLLAMEKANAAKATADDAKGKADAHDAILPELKETVGSDHTALGKLALSVGDIDIADIDTLSNIDKNHGRYLRVKSGNRTQGWLMNLPCYAGHIQQQIFTTYLPLDENGNITTHHDEDSAVHVYKRLYNIDRGNLTISNGETIAESEWSKWVEVGGEAVWTTIEQAKSEILGMLPALNDVLEFGGIFNDVTIQENPSTRSSTDIRCKVIYDKTSEKFLLAVAKANITDEDWSSLWGNVNTTPPTNPGQHGEITPTTPTIKVPSLGDDGVIDKFGDGVMTSFNFYDTWADMNLYCDSDKNPLRGKVYIDTTNEMTYRYNGSTLVSVGSSLAIGTAEGTAADGAVVAGLVEKVGNITFINAQKLLNIGTYSTIDNVIAELAQTDIEKSLGLVVTFKARDGWESWQWIGPNFTDAANWQKYGGGSAIGNCFNVTNKRIELDERNGEGANATYFDDFASAVRYTFHKNQASLGMQITFAVAPKSWKTYQYVGATLVRDDFLAEANWIDMAGLSAGDEDFININRLCNHPGAYGGLAFALADLATKETQSGITYRKPGLVIEYRSDDQRWEMKKFIGNIEQFQNAYMWEDVGSGTEAAIEAKDEPEEGGADAFSTGGAYNLIPVNRSVVRDGAETTITLLNSAGEAIFDPIVIVATGGGGGEGGVAIGITAEKSTFYAALGNPMVARFAIRSESITSGGATPNAIERVEIIDRDTNQSVYTWTGSMDSADSLNREDEDYNFTVDLKDIFSTASVKRLLITATDEKGKTATRSFQAVAEDVTITCRQPLDYNSGNHVSPTSTEESMDCYQFVNTTSAVTAYVDMLIGGEWVNIHQKLLNDSNKNYTKSIRFNPSELGLTHGAYQIRMYGISQNSGVKGNTVYSTIFVVEEGNDHSMVGLRYNDTNDGRVRNFDSIEATVAAYKPGNVTGLDIDVALDSSRFATVHLTSGQTATVTTKITGHDTGDELRLQAHVGAVFSPAVTLTVNGSAVDVSLKENAAIHFDFASRSNSESDHTISSNGVTMTVNGANWLTNGFIKYRGETALRIAENVRASIPFAPFGSSAIENNGMALQMRFATDNIADKDALLFDCYDPTSGAGIYIKGNEVGICNGAHQVETRRFACGEIHTLQVVAEPGTIYEVRSNTKYAHLYMYLDGEKVARLPYTPDMTPSDLLNTKTMGFDGRHGDFYLYNLVCWNSYFEWSAAMSNYLAKLNDVGAMITEFEFEDVLRAQSAEGVQMMRPQIEALLARGIACTVLVGSDEDFDRFDSGTDTSENFYFDVYHFDPTPWRSWIGRHVRIRRQGTTSAKRPKKNVRMYLNQATSVEPMYPNYADEHALTPEQLLDLQTTYALYAMKYVRVEGSSIPVQVITIKIDYSDSTGANDSGTCNMLNATFRSLAQTDPMYLTPAQRAYDGTWDKSDVHLTGLQMNHSTANAVCAVFRSTDNMRSSYFEAKGNFKEDKAEQVALGFINTPGYNLGCKNWQSNDFKFIFGTPGETLDQMEARFKAMDGLDTDQLYLLQPYCSRNYRFMRHRGGQWQMSPGSMRQINGRWVVTGDVLNPVNGWEMLNYTGMNWCQGVASLSDLMRGTTEYSSWVQKLINKGKISDGAEVPAWTYYFECMVDNDDLALAYAQGKVVPFELYQFLRFTDAADYASKENWQTVWRNSAWKYLSLRSNYVTRAAEDYNSMRDSVSKNKQPMAFLEEGHCVVNGVYDPEVEGADDADGFNCEFGITDQQSPFIVYFNKVYDIDGANDKDNDGGGTGDPEEDPDKPTDAQTGYVNTYAGWGSVLFKSCVMQDEAVVNGNGDTLSYRATVKAMRSCQTTLPDGSLLYPFSPEGALYYYVTSRTRRWPKQVSSYDGYRKYEQYTATSDAVYFYALQGLGLTSIPQYIATRWRFRDGFYETGAFNSLDSAISGRIEGPEDGKITIKAKKAGYFGVGNDSPMAVSERVYLEAGEIHSFTNFRKNNNALLFIFQADRLESIDLSEFSLSDTFDFSHMKLAETIIIGGEDHVNRAVAFNKLTHPNLGSLPFLQTLDIRNTEIEAINAEGCPRLLHLHADGSSLSTLTLAPTSPINDVTLPATMTELRFVGLPALSYPGGLTSAGLGSIGTLIVKTSPRINAARLLSDIIAAQDPADSVLGYVTIEDSALSGDGSEMKALVERGVCGIDGSLINPKPIVRGEYSLTVIIEQDDIDYIEEGIEGITMTVVIDAFINAINEVNGEMYAGMEEVEGITVDNIDELALRYYNGETYEQWLERYVTDNANINSITE